MYRFVVGSWLQVESKMNELSQEGWAFKALSAIADEQFEHIYVVMVMERKPTLERKPRTVEVRQDAAPAMGSVARGEF